MNFFKTIFFSMVLVGLACIHVSETRGETRNEERFDSPVMLKKILLSSDFITSDGLSQADQEALDEINDLLHDVAHDLADDQNDAEWQYVVLTFSDLFKAHFHALSSNAKTLLAGTLKASVNAIMANFGLGASFVYFSWAINNITSTESLLRVKSFLDLLSPHWHLACANNSIAAVVNTALALLCLHAAKEHGSWALQNIGGMLKIYTQAIAQLNEQAAGLSNPEN